MTARPRQSSAQTIRAFEALVHSEGPGLYQLALRLVGNVEAARELRQDTLCSAWQSFESLRGPVGPWLRAILLNRFRDELRRLGSRAPSEPLLAGLEPLESGPAPVEAAASSEAGRRVAQAVAQLPPEERLVVVLRHYEELSTRTIADELGTPHSTIKDRLSRGLGRLALALSDPSLR